MPKNPKKRSGKSAALSREEIERAIKQRSFRTVDAPDFVVGAVRRADMDKRHDRLNRLMTSAIRRAP